MDLSEINHRLHSIRDTQQYLRTQPLGWLVAFWEHEGLRTSIFHLLMSRAPIHLLPKQWNYIFNKFSDFGKRRVLSRVWLDGAGLTPLERLLERPDIQSTLEPHIHNWLRYLFHYSDIQRYLSRLPVSWKMELVPEHLPECLQRLVADFV